MTKQLETIFGELGITQYLDIFLDQGFDTWDTILDITESDLDALGVKLGHRRKLQRRIANFRGLAPDASLVSPTVQPSLDEQKQEPNVKTSIKIESHDVATMVVAKRKYRRHPKPDENAPERPPSAYVLFSNKMREDLRGRNLTFTEIAKLVGEHWQNLSVAEKEPFESQAQSAKDRYNNQLAEYRKTADYKKYQEYLEEFRARYAHQSKDKDVTKRVKLSSPKPTQNIMGTNHRRTSRSRSGSPPTDFRISEEASRRHNRLGSVVSATDSQVSATPASRQLSMDDAVHSPFDRRSLEHSPVIRASPRDGAPRLLPSLSDVFDGRGALSSGGQTSGEVAGLTGFPFPLSYNPESAGPPPGLIDGDRKPGLKKEQSSTGSISSGSSYSYPRTPIEGTLPIHALLSEKPQQVFGPVMQFHGNPVPQDHKSPFLQRQHPDGLVTPLANGLASGVVYGRRRSPSVPAPQPSFKAPPRTQPSVVKPEPNLDGMSALLRAGEIVDRRSS